MARKNTKKRPVVGSTQGGNLFLIAGLPRDTLEWIKGILIRDTSKSPARYVGAPSPQKDWSDLYKGTNLAEILKLIERESSSLKPHRIIVLYVPSRDAINLISALDSVCFLAPLMPENDSLPSDGNVIGWRHKKPLVKDIVNRTLQKALSATNTLKAEITDSRISALALPARNFYYPDRYTTIGSAYESFVQQGFKATDLVNIKNSLLPTRFTREQLPQNAFKGQQYTDKFFQDCRGRVFPPDPYHAQNRADYKETLSSGISGTLRQRYRFGVTVRDGNLHYDVQFERPRELIMEPMYCAVDGDVWITASHANVGVNDVIWVPDGKKDLQRTK